MTRLVTWRTVPAAAEDRQAIQESGRGQYPRDGGGARRQGAVRAGHAGGPGGPRRRAGRETALVATATAIALFVDGVRVPVYVARNGLGGTAVLGRLPERLFRRAVRGLLVALGIHMAPA